MRQLILVTTLAFLIYSCEENGVYNQISRQWIIHSASIDNKNSTNGTDFFLTNVITFYSDGTCNFPILLESLKNSSAYWELEKKGEVYYLIVTECSEEFYNDTYLLNLEEYKNISKMKLDAVSKDFSITCYEVLTF